MNDECPLLVNNRTAVKAERLHIWVVVFIQNIPAFEPVKRSSNQTIYPSSVNLLYLFIYQGQQTLINSIIMIIIIGFSALLRTYVCEWFFWCVCVFLLFVCLFSSNSSRERRRQDTRLTPSAHWSDPGHPPGDARHGCRRAGHRLHLPSPHLCSQPLPHRGELGR